MSDNSDKFHNPRSNGPAMPKRILNMGNKQSEASMANIFPNTKAGAGNVKNAASDYTGNSAKKGSSTVKSAGGGKQK